jgi:hypothetical protein
MGATPEGVSAEEMIDCRNCIHWVDESLVQIETGAQENSSHIFMGCRIFGFQENPARETCPNYAESKNLFTLCDTCRIPVPKICISLGECVNCTDTDLFCIDHCMGGDQRKYCTHFVRLFSEGIHLIDNDRAFDLFPEIGMPKTKKQPPTD